MKTYLIALCLAAGILSAAIAALMATRAQDWQAQAEAEHADWLDEMNTRESVRPL